MNTKTFNLDSSLHGLTCSETLINAENRTNNGSNQLAVHQYRFGLLPRSPLIEKYTTLPARVVTEDFAVAWLQQPTCDVIRLIDGFAPRYRSWSEDILMWGTGNNGNRIHVVFEDTKIAEVSCRIAVPQEHESFAVGVISLAKRCDWLLVLTHDVLAEPDVDKLLTAVRESNAAKFAVNPVEFFEGLSTDKYQPE